MIIDKEIYDEVKKELISHNCYFLNKEEIKKVEKLVINENTCAVNPEIVGMPAAKIAEKAGIKVAEDTKILIAEIGGVGSDFPLSREKLSPVLACFKVNSLEEGLTRPKKCLNLEELVTQPSSIQRMMR